VLINTLRKTVQDDDCAVLFADRTYFVYYRLRGGAVTGSYSCFFEHAPDSVSCEGFRNALGDSGKVYAFGNARTIGFFPFTVESPAGTLKEEAGETLFFRTFAPFSASHFVPLSRTRPLKSRTFSFHPGYLLAAVVYLGLVLFLVQPVLLSRRAGSQLVSMKQKMEATFRDTFPGVTNLVDPLSQAQERVKGAPGADTLAVRVSPLDVMAEITRLVPETIPFKVLQLSVRGPEVFILCGTNSLSDINRIEEKFRGDSYFSDVKIVGISFTGNAVNFNIIAKMAK
jgi:hypothetical protein